MLIDDVTIKVKAGKGGDGLATFSKVVLENGPTGGDGGRGGNVVAEGVTDLGALRQFRYKKKVVADDGRPGGQNRREGASGRDAVIKLPVGTVIHNLETGEQKEITGVGERVIIARGGRGGFGNYHYRSSRNTSPTRADEGEPGEEFDVRLELKLIADIGLIGYPNVGKSTFLNVFTGAKSKVANYQFTTLEPHLGVYYGLILADIPGLIKGASRGRGLGHKFLQHIERTKMLFHFIAADSLDPVNDYLIVRRELGKYNEKLLQKPEWIILSRVDEVSQEDLEKIKKKLKRYNKNIRTLSILDDESVGKIKEFLNEIKNGKF